MTSVGKKVVYAVIYGSATYDHDASYSTGIEIISLRRGKSYYRHLFIVEHNQLLKIRFTHQLLNYIILR